MDAELLRALLHQDAVGLEHLRLRHAVFGVPGGVHYRVRYLKIPAGVEAAADGLGNVADGPLQEIDVSDVVEVDGGAELVREGEVLRRRVVRGEHDVRPGYALTFAEHQLRERGAVHAAAFLVQDVHDGRIGRGLDREVLLEALVPRKSLANEARVAPYPALVVEMVRRREPLVQLQKLLFGHKR